MKKLFIVFSAIFMMAVSCQEKTSVTPFNGNISRVKSGQSFGMCIGKCYNELVIENNSLVLKQLNRKERGGETETTEFSDNSLLKQVKADLNGFSQNKFLKLKEVYGCPDCADGGEEWLEVQFSNGTVKKVRFEYGSSVEGFEDVISRLRGHRISLMEKYR